MSKTIKSSSHAKVPCANILCEKPVIPNREIGFCEKIGDDTLIPFCSNECGKKLYVGMEIIPIKVTDAETIRALAKRFDIPPKHMQGVQHLWVRYYYDIYEKQHEAREIYIPIDRGVYILANRPNA